MTQFQDPFYHLIKILFLDSNIVSPQLNLMDGRYKQTEKTSWTNKGMEKYDYVFNYFFILLQITSQFPVC